MLPVRMHWVMQASGGMLCGVQCQLRWPVSPSYGMEGFLCMGVDLGGNMRTAAYGLWVTVLQHALLPWDHCQGCSVGCWLALGAKHGAGVCDLPQCCMYSQPHHALGRSCVSSAMPPIRD